MRKLNITCIILYHHENSLSTQNPYPIRILARNKPLSSYKIQIVTRKSPSLDAIPILPTHQNPNRNTQIPILSLPLHADPYPRACRKYVQKICSVSWKRSPIGNAPNFPTASFLPCYFHVIFFSHDRRVKTDWVEVVHKSSASRVHQVWTPAVIFLARAKWKKVQVQKNKMPSMPCPCKIEIRNLQFASTQTFSPFSSSTGQVLHHTPQVVVDCWIETRI